MSELNRKRAGQIIWAVRDFQGLYESGCCHDDPVCDVCTRDFLRDVHEALTQRSKNQEVSLYELSKRAVDGDQEAALEFLLELSRGLVGR